MIIGIVNKDHEPVIRISVLDNNNQVYEWEAVIDTGFNGWLTLPHHFITTLGLSWQRLGTAILADGQQIFFDVYEATILWDGQPIVIPVDEAESEPLVGMLLMSDHELTVRCAVGGIVMLQKSSHN